MNGATRKYNPATENQRKMNEGTAAERIVSQLPPLASALPNPALSLPEQSTDILLAMCLFGEARGETEPARRAVAQVVLNRARHPHRVFGSRRGLTLDDNVRRVILQPRQFSCFMPSDINYAKLLRPAEYEATEVWTRCLESARAALASADTPDSLTHNSDHYFDDSIQPPAWADPAKQTVVLGRLRFFRIYLPSLGAGSGHSSRLRVKEAAAVPPFPPTSSQAAVFAVREARSASAPAPHLPSQRSPRLGSPMASEPGALQPWRRGGSGQPQAGGP